SRGSEARPQPNKQSARHRITVFRMERFSRIDDGTEKDLANAKSNRWRVGCNLLQDDSRDCGTPERPSASNKRLARPGAAVSQTELLTTTSVVGDTGNTKQSGASQHQAGVISWRWATIRS